MGSFDVMNSLNVILKVKILQRYQACYCVPHTRGSTQAQSIVDPNLRTFPQ